MPSNVNQFLLSRTRDKVEVRSSNLARAVISKAAKRPLPSVPFPCRSRCTTSNTANYRMPSAAV